MAKHSYTKKAQYAYTCGKCNKTWIACNFFDIAVCPHCLAKSVVQKEGKCRLNNTCACKA